MYRVFLGDRFVGRIEPDRGRLAFTYAEAAVDDAGVPALSVRLPKRTEPYDDADARPFFENLLPEEEFRRLIAAAVRTSPGNTAGLLGAIAGECAGAVSVWPEGRHPPRRAEYRELAPHDLRDLFHSPDDPRLVRAQRRGRLSLAGAQPKLTLRGDGDRWLLPLNGAPATHILKRTRHGVPYLVENEFFAMRLAAAAGLLVPKVAHTDAGVPLLVVARFDRVATGSPAAAAGGVARRHQEDFCQAAGVLPAAKYEAEGGPGIATCASLLRSHSAVPVADLRRLAEWVAFNFLLGNEDAHGKNLALLYGDDGVRLAPFYDLLSTAVYRGLSRKAAMAIGGERRHRWVRRRHWERCAADLGLPTRAALRTFRHVADRVAAELDAAREATAVAFGDVTLIEAVAATVVSRIAQLRRETA